MITNSTKFCNEFYPQNENYVFNPSPSMSNYAECRHCVHKNSAKCLHSVYQAPTFDILG